VTRLLKAGIVETEDTAVGRQRFAKHFPAATITHATTEKPLGAVFSMRSVTYHILKM
jgi:hypothetical protein